MINDIKAKINELIDEHNEWEEEPVIQDEHNKEVGEEITSITKCVCGADLKVKIDYENNRAFIEGEYPKEPKKWKPGAKESYWYIHFDGEILKTDWSNGYIDKVLYKFGNYFKTKEQAEEARDAIKSLLNNL